MAQHGTNRGRIKTNEEKSFVSRVLLKNVSEQKYDLSRIFKYQPRAANLNREFEVRAGDDRTDVRTADVEEDDRLQVRKSSSS
jgi:hypothetical protein